MACQGFDRFFCNDFNNTGAGMFDFILYLAVKSMHINIGMKFYILSFIDV